MYSNASVTETTTAAAIPRRRQRVGRRRFRYRKQAWCLLASLLILSLGANLFIMVRILMFTAEPKTPEITVATKLSSSSNANINSGSISNNTAMSYLSIVAKFLGLLLAIVILARGLKVRLAFTMLVRGLQPLHFWKAIVLAPIAFVSDSFRAALIWCWGGNINSSSINGINRHASPEATSFESNTVPRPAITVAETLEAFNRERLARGESTVSTESIEAYERFLRDLATFIVVDEDSDTATAIVSNTNRGIPKAQLDELCPRWTINGSESDKNEIESHRCRRHFSSQTECGICLEAYCEKVPSEEGNSEEGRVELRTLPCKHIFHAHCIDQWLQRSASCPTCKASIFSSTNSENRRRSNSTNISNNEINENIFIL